MKTAYYKPIQTESGWHWNLYAPNNRCILTCAKHEDSSEAIESQIDHFINGTLVIVSLPSEDNQFYFVAESFKGTVSVKGVSETYRTKNGRNKAAETVKKYFKTTRIIWSLLSQ